MARKNALRLRPKELFAAAAKQTLYSEFVEHDKIYCFQHIAWTIDKVLSGGSTRARLHIDGHGYNHLLAEQDNPDASVVWTYSKSVWLIPGERLALELANVQANTTAEMNITGYWTEQQEGVI